MRSGVLASALRYSARNVRPRGGGHTESSTVPNLVSGHEWRERRIRKSLQQSCHLHRAAADLYSLCRPLPLARSPPGAPNRVPGASSAAPATKNPPKVDNGRCDPISFWMPSSAQVTVRTNLQPGHMIDSKKTDRRIMRTLRRARYVRKVASCGGCERYYGCAAWVAISSCAR